MSGTVGIIANDNARYSLFSVRLTQLRSPVNTKLDWALTSDRIIGRNSLARRAVDEGAEWLMFLDDDHVFNGDILMRLLAHDELVVGALYLQRQIPFSPIAYTGKNDDGSYESLDLTLAPGEGLLRVHALGTGGMLIRTEVFRGMEYPWFEHGVASEDLMFCDKLAGLGVPVYVDLGTLMGHMTQTSIWPSYNDGAWNVGFSVADNFSMKLRIAAPEEVPEEAVT